MQSISNRLVLITMLIASTSARGVIVTPDLEVVTVPGVGNTFQTVSLENTYTNAIPICTYNLPSSAGIPAVVRIDNITANSFDVKIQRAASSGTETPGDVHCIVSETGEFTEGGMHWEAGSLTPNVTSGRSNFGVKAADTVIPLGTYTTPVVLHQVISHNDTRWSATWTYSNSSANPPTATNIHVGKHVASDTDTARADERLGYIIAETGSGNERGVDYELALGADTVDGVDNAGTSYTLSSTYRHGIASQNAMDGGDGGWAVLFGASPLASNQIDVAIDEDTIADGERAHTTEQVAYWTLEPVTVTDLAVTIDDGSATYAPGSTLIYTIVVTNNGVNDTSSATLVNNEPVGTTFTSWTCIASGAASCANASGVGSINETSTNLPVGDTLTFAVNVDVPSSFSGNLVNTATVSTTSTDNISTNDSATDTDTQSSLIDLEVSKDNGTTTFTPGTTVAYTVSVTNNGPSDASSVLVTDTAPAGTTISSWTCTCVSCPAASGSGNIAETAATLASGDSLVYTVNVDVPSSFSGSLTNTATASAAETESNNTNNSASDTDLLLSDADGDGILDSVEIGPNPSSPIDSDGDGVPDYLEDNNADTDGDGINNHADNDDDGDGLPTRDELGSGGGLNPADSDGDGIADYLSASVIQTGLDGGTGSMNMYLMLFAFIGMMLNKIIIRRRAKCSTGQYRH